MGYYTDYTLNVENDVKLERLREIDAAVFKIDGGIFENWNSGGGYWYAEEQKWYSQERDMLELSLQFPDVRFCLHGNGEDDDDLWDEYWENGCYQHCHSEIPPYDPSKMRRVYVSIDGNSLTTAPPVEEDLCVMQLPDM
jgi:hypothetical protein